MGDKPADRFENADYLQKQLDLHLDSLAIALNRYPVWANETTQERYIASEIVHALGTIRRCVQSLTVLRSYESISVSNNNELWQSLNKTPAFSNFMRIPDGPNDGGALVAGLKSCITAETVLELIPKERKRPLEVAKESPIAPSSKPAKKHRWWHGFFSRKHSAKNEPVAAESHHINFHKNSIKQKIISLFAKTKIAKKWNYNPDKMIATVKTAHGKIKVTEGGVRANNSEDETVSMMSEMLAASIADKYNGEPLTVSILSRNADARQDIENKIKRVLQDVYGFKSEALNSITMRSVDTREELQPAGNNMLRSAKSFVNEHKEHAQEESASKRPQR